ncbi:MAG: hypothetical protein LBU73_03750 [Helicobacteraceae bacterium]|nr:hypothetical protein [Helicobacteraceae bacterium]
MPVHMPSDEYAVLGRLPCAATNFPLPKAIGALKICSLNGVFATAIQFTPSDECAISPLLYATATNLPPPYAIALMLTFPNVLFGASVHTPATSASAVADGLCAVVNGSSATSVGGLNVPKTAKNGKKRLFLAEFGRFWAHLRYPISSVPSNDRHYAIRATGTGRYPNKARQLKGQGF